MVHDCYSLETFNKAYETNIMPCRDKSTWDHVDGREVKAPVYEKKVGRPKRCRRKEPYEIQGKNGPKLSKHGVIITCSYCKQENHNAKGCFFKKKGIRPEDYDPEVHGINPQAPPAPINDEPPVQTQDEPIMVPPVREVICDTYVFRTFLRCSNGFLPTALTSDWSKIDV
jgi:hypothetical protein